MSFHFPHETILRFRQSVEHQQEMRLRAANQQVTRVQRLIEQLDVRCQQIQEYRSQGISRGTTAAEMRFLIAAETAAQQTRRELEREFSRLRQLRDQQRTVFEQARRDRETVESLREHEFREYRRVQIRRSQRQLDEFFLLRASLFR